MDNLHVRLNFNLSKEKGNTAKKNIMKLVNCKIWLRNVVKLGKYSLAKFVYVCVTCGNCYNFRLKNGNKFPHVIQTYTRLYISVFYNIL
jgi:hypothetical protein